jgi:hypothetical protein
MPGLMFDSEDVSVLTAVRLAGCRVATYADLMTRELQAALAGRLVVIDRGLGDPLAIATVADIEPGALTVAQGVSVMRQWLSEGRAGVTAYHDRSEWPAVNQQLGPTVVYHWVATLDGTANPLGEYPDVVQVLAAKSLGFAADLSVVWQDNWHPVPQYPTQAQIEAVVRLADTYAPGFADLMTAVKGL